MEEIKVLNFEEAKQIVGLAEELSQDDVRKFMGDDIKKEEAIKIITNSVQSRQENGLIIGIKNENEVLSLIVSTLEVEKNILPQLGDKAVFVQARSFLTKTSARNNGFCKDLILELKKEVEKLVMGESEIALQGERLKRVEVLRGEAKEGKDIFLFSTIDIRNPSSYISTMNAGFKVMKVDERPDFIDLVTAVPLFKKEDMKKVEDLDISDKVLSLDIVKKVLNEKKFIARDSEKKFIIVE